MHLYLGVDCRTPNCNTFHVLKYLGEKDHIPDDTPISIPAPLWLHCPNCGLDHDFSSSHLRQVEREETPPSETR